MSKIIIFLLICISSLFGAIGNLFLKLTTKYNIKGLSILNLSNTIVLKKIFLYFLSLSFYMAGFILWAYILTKINLNKAYPIYIGLTIVLISVLSIFFLGESITYKVIIGYLIIFIGISILI